MMVWVPLVTAGLGLVAGIGAAVLTQQRTDRREDIRWQREREPDRISGSGSVKNALLKNVSLLSLSAEPPMLQ